MATRTLEARFERMSVNDENISGDGGKLYSKATKVWAAALYSALKPLTLMAVSLTRRMEL